LDFPQTAMLRDRGYQPLFLKRTSWCLCDLVANKIFLWVIKP
jgi:hypothetical protein